MPEIPPDPRAVINARIHSFKKKTQKLNLEVLEAEAEVERAKQVVRENRQASLGKTAAPAPRPVATAASRPTVTIQRFAVGVGYSLKMEETSLWFDTETHAIEYGQDVFPHCDILVFEENGTVKQRFPASDRAAHRGYPDLGP